MNEVRDSTDRRRDARRASCGRSTGRRSWFRGGLVPSLLVVVVASGGCSLFQEEVPEPPSSAPLKVVVAVDNSASYGLDEDGERHNDDSEIFDEARQYFLDRLLGVLQDGDDVIGVFPFTDEAISALTNVISDDGIIRVDSAQEYQDELIQTLNDIELRPELRDTSYITEYRPVLAAAARQFQRVQKPSQRLVLLLTDVHGSLAPQGSDVSPEDFRDAYVLVMRATPTGTLETTANELLQELAGEDVALAAYVDAIRAAYRESNPVWVTRIRTDSVVFSIALLPALATLVVIVLVRRRTAAGRRRAAARRPRLDSVFYNPGLKIVVVNGHNLPKAPVDYIIDDGDVGVDKVEPRTGRVHLRVATRLTSGPHTLLVPTVSKEATTFSSPPQEVYRLSVARVDDPRNPKSIDLQTDWVHLLKQLGLDTLLQVRQRANKLEMRTTRGKVKVNYGDVNANHAFNLEEEKHLLELVDENNTLILLTITRSEQ